MYDSKATHEEYHALNNGIIQETLSNPSPKYKNRFNSIYSVLMKRAPDCKTNGGSDTDQSYNYRMKTG